VGDELDKTHPGAAASLREGMAGMLTICAWTCYPPSPALCSTNPGVDDRDCRDYSKNVKRWRDGTMALRWCAAGIA